MKFMSGIYTAICLNTHVLYEKLKAVMVKICNNKPWACFKAL